MSRINRTKIKVRDEGFSFKPFRPTKEDESALSEAQLKPDNELLVFERGGQRRALLLPEMAYHHVCQGELAGVPYLVTF